MLSYDLKPNSKSKSLWLRFPSVVFPLVHHLSLWTAELPKTGALYI